MSAEAVGRGRDSGWQPDSKRQRLASYTLEDVLNLPPDAPRVELVNGVMLVVPSPTARHQNTGALIWLWLRRNAPDDHTAVLAVGVAVENDRTYEPDVLLLRPGVDDQRHFFAANEVVLVVEVVSRNTRARDRFAKPAEYAAAGIPYYWRVEQDPVHIYAYRLGAAGNYELAADSSDALKLDEPFALTLPIAEVTP